MNYKICVYPEPDFSMGGKPFFWVIFKYDSEWHNIGCGWSVTAEKAFEEAKTYYDTWILNR